MSMMLNDVRMAHDPAGRGYHVVYREHEVNHCPGCGRTHWIIGRVSAECAFCTTALRAVPLPRKSGGGIEAAKPLR